MGFTSYSDHALYKHHSDVLSKSIFSEIKKKLFDAYNLTCHTGFLKQNNNTSLPYTEIGALPSP